MKRKLPFEEPLIKSEEEPEKQEKEPEKRETPEEKEEKDGPKKELEEKTPETTQESLETIREELEQLTKEQETPLSQEKELFGDFENPKINEDDRIELSSQEKRDTEKQLKTFKRSVRLSPPSLLSGAETATEYDSQATNFSTRTQILTLENGKRVFAVYNYPFSRFHRVADTFCKRMAGDRMTKARSKEWKKQFEQKSEVPIIETDDSNTVLMPFLPNINSHDLFAYSQDIEYFGECDWAQELKKEDKLEIAERIVQELQRIHQKGKTWGETILPNIIITKDRQIVFVDPETSYDKGVPKKEQKARDLRDLVTSICGALHHSNPDITDDFSSIVDRLLSQYQDKEVVRELKKLTSQKSTLVQRIFRRFYETSRLGISFEQYQRVNRAFQEEKEMLS